MIYREATVISAAISIEQLNRELARNVNHDARSNPYSPYANKWVGIANGQIVVVADEMDEMLRRLRQIEPDPRKTFGLAASEDPDEVHEIWSVAPCRS